MKYILTVCILALSIGCAGLTPNQASKYTPIAVLTVIESLQTSVIEKANNKEISESSAKVLVTFTVEAAKIVKEATNDFTYKELISARLKQLRDDLLVMDEAKFTAILDLLEKNLDQR